MAEHIYLNLNEKPRIVLSVMDNVYEEAVASRKRWNWGCGAVFSLILLGVPFCLLDTFMGYNVLTFSIVAGLLWLAATALAIWLIFSGRAGVEKGKFDFARQVIHTLRDDVALEKGRLTGWLDLTGHEQESKITRKGRTSSGKPKTYYRDPWLQFKTRLADGNLLRLAMIEDVKVKKGFVADRQLKVKAKLVVDPKTSQILPFTGEDMRTNAPLWQVNNQGGIIEVSGSVDPKNLDAAYILGILKWAYGHIQPLQAAGPASR